MVEVGGIAADQLRTIIERIERLEEEKAALGADIREIFVEAKGNGFDTKALRQVLKLRKMEVSERQEQEATLDLYQRALGMRAEMSDLFEKSEGEETKITISAGGMEPVTLTGTQLSQAAAGAR